MIDISQLLPLSNMRLKFILEGTDTNRLELKRQRNYPATISASNPGSEIFLFLLCHDLFSLLFPCLISQAGSHVNLAGGRTTVEFVLKESVCHVAPLDSR